MDNFDPSMKIDAEQLLKRVKHNNSFDEQNKRTKKLLGCKTDTEMEVSKETLRKYLTYLKKNIEMPCHLTGVEDFPWEERYVFGYGDPKEYEKLKKKQPSYTDTFNLIDYEIEDLYIYVKVQRLGDKKKFELPLDDLKAVDENTKNYSILNDYSVWRVNH
jgi:hypothetical protein